MSAPAERSEPAAPAAAHRAPEAGWLGRAALGFAVLAAIYAGGIYWSSSQPNPTFVPPELLSHDKILHACAYAGLAFLLRLALAGTRLRPRTAFLVALAVASLYGVSDELHQRFVPNRQCDPADWAADTAGAVAGAAVAAAFLRRRGGAG